MDEDIAIINAKTRNEKFKNFFIKNKRLLLLTCILLILSVLSFYFFQIYENGQREKLSNKYNNSIIEYKKDKIAKTLTSMKDVVNHKDSTYSPLALYFLIDNNLIEDKEEINELFNILINETPLKDEIKHLIIYKKALFNADDANENELLSILNPIINSKSVWKSHSLYLLAEYFYAKNEKQKSKEFFNKIISLENANRDIIKESIKRLNRDIGD